MIRPLVLAALISVSASASPADLTGAWTTVRDDGAAGTMILSGDYISIAWYKTDPAEFLYTKGGSWSLEDDGSLAISFEFNTKDPEQVGQTKPYDLSLSGDELTIGGSTWTRVDDGTPGALEGAWLSMGNKRDGEIRTRTPGARRTMKILSGTRFQWIAYNVETKEFFGSGGGTYTTENGKYTENIEFFSRDASTVGRSLPFDYDIVDGIWHHQGKSSKGDPKYELWGRREDLGI